MTIGGVMMALRSELELDHIPARGVFMSSRAAYRVHDEPLVPADDFNGSFCHFRRYFHVDAEWLDRDEWQVAGLCRIHLIRGPELILDVQRGKDDHHLGGLELSSVLILQRLL